MPSVNFNLRTKQDKVTTIMLVFRHNNKRIMLTTEQKIPIQFWDTKKQRAKAQKWHEGRMINVILDKLYSATMAHYRKQVIQNQMVTKESLKSHVSKILNNDSGNFIEYGYKTTERKLKEGKFKEQTATTRKRILKLIENYQNNTRTCGL